MDFDDSDYVEVVVRREQGPRQVLAGFLALALLVASCAVWGPTWPLHAAQWALDHVIRPLGDWIANGMSKAPTDVSPNAPGAGTPLP